MKFKLPSHPGGRMLSLAASMESSISKAGLDNRHRNKDGEISHKHGNILIGAFRRDHGTGHLDHKIANASK